MPDTITLSAHAHTARGSHAVSSTDLEAAISTASTAYVSARDNAANAAATVYYIWFHACSEHASAQNKQWYGGKRNARMAQINEWNAKIDENKAKEEKAIKKQVNALRSSKREANDPNRIEELDAQIRSLQDASKNRLRALTSERKVKLEARPDATEFTEITKLVLELDKPTQSSQVNRFATVVKWIATNCANEAQLSVEVIANRILDADGFDNVYALQRAADGKTSKTSGAANTDAGSKGEPDEARKAVLDHFCNVVAGADALATVPLHHPREPNSLVALIGRVCGDGVTVISEMEMSVEKVLDLCVTQKDQTLLPGDASCEFLATALAAGNLVSEGKRAGKDGEATQITRALSMLVNTDGGRLVISALNTDVSVVVHATPKPLVRGLLPQSGWWKLPHESVEQLGKRLEDRIARKMFTLRVNETEREVGDNLLPSPFAWETTNGPLATKGDPSATLLHPWLAMSPREDTPLDIEGFSPSGTVTLLREDLLRLSKGKIANWTANNTKDAGEKNSALVTVTISRSEINVESVQGPDAVPCRGSIKGTVSLKFRPRMLAKAFAQIAILGTGNVQFTPDPRGALQMRFEDACGSYDIFVPACGKDGALKTARFCQIAVPEMGDD